MRQNVKELEYRQFFGLDARSDRFQVVPSYQTTVKNMRLVKGVLETRPGYSQWGSLDDSSISATLRKKKGFDVGDDEHILMHKGTGLYYGLKDDSSYTQIKDIASSNIVVVNAESEFEILGKSTGSTTGNQILKVLFKQEAGCFVLEWDGTDWIGRSPGLDATDADFTLAAAAGGSAPDGEYRCRLVAMRIVDGVRVIESIHTGGDSNQLSYRSIDLASPNNKITFTVTHSTPDALITHYMLQVTRPLDMVGDSEYSENGNDPSLYYETTPVTAAAALAGATIEVDNDNLGIPAFNFFGFKTIPGHLISVVTGGLVFLSGIGKFQNRVYKAGLSGYYYHNEYYDEFEFYDAGEEDGQLLTGLGVVQDHLVIFKEGKTGIVANREVREPVTWRDKKIGCLNRNGFGNISEDEMIVLCQDGIFRIFNGIRYDREREVEGEQRYFSENIRNISEDIDPNLVEYMFHRERLNIVYGADVAREALVLHPRDGMGWTQYDSLFHFNNFLVNNGNDWIFSKNGLLYEQSAKTPVYQDDGLDITWEVTFALLTSQVSRKNKALLKIAGIEGDFDNPFYTSIRVDGGRIETSLFQAFPVPEQGTTTPWFQLNLGDDQISGNYIEITLKGVGYALIRGLYLGMIEKKSGNLGWSQEIYNPDDWSTQFYLVLDAGSEVRNV